MSERFLGVQMKREYTWGYTCVHCGKSTEFKSALFSRYGATATKGVMSGTVFSLTDEGKEQYLKKARSDFPRALEITMAQWKNDNIYPSDVSDKKHSICPHCRKHQQWSKEIIDFEGKLRIGEVAAAIFGSIFIAALIALIPFLIFKNSIIFLSVWAVLSIASIPIMVKGERAITNNLIKVKADLQNMEKKFPYFISWGDTTEEIFN